jgi:NAD(P)-dependent dehydrogenase (short-subunit alcohol dehydrogenase family)
MGTRLQGKVAIVTGTSPNIGGGIAEMFAQEGARLTCVDYDEANALDCARAIERDGGQALGMRCDVRDEAQVKAVIEATLKRFGQLDVLVNGAVVYNMKGLLTMSVEEFRSQVDLILAGTFLFTKHGAQAMIDGKRRGSIIHITSTEAHQGNPKNVAYCTAKAGLLNMARANAMELCAYGIRVNTLTPTATHPAESVDRAERWGRPRWDISDHLAIKRGKLLPAGSPPAPSDYAYGAVYLASDESKMVTGFDLRVDAGAIARYWGWGQDTLG